MSTEREKEFLLKLADLCEEYKAGFEIYEDQSGPTIIVENLSISDIGYLGVGECQERLRKAASELK